MKNETKCPKHNKSVSHTRLYARSTLILLSIMRQLFQRKKIEKRLKNKATVDAFHRREYINAIREINYKWQYDLSYFTNEKKATSKGVRKWVLSSLISARRKTLEEVLRNMDKYSCKDGFGNTVIPYNKLKQKIEEELEK